MKKLHRIILEVIIVGILVPLVVALIEKEDTVVYNTNQLQKNAIDNNVSLIVENNIKDNSSQLGILDKSEKNLPKKVYRETIKDETDSVLVLNQKKEGSRFFNWLILQI